MLKTKARWRWVIRGGEVCFDVDVLPYGEINTFASRRDASLGSHG